MDSDTGSSSQASNESVASTMSNPFLAVKGTGSSQGVLQQRITAGRKKRRYLEPDSNSGESRSTDPLQPIDNQSGTMQHLETLQALTLVYEWAITELSLKSAKTICSQFRWNELFQFFGVTVVQEKLVALGKRPVYSLILREERPNGGAASRIMKTLSWMTLEETSRSLCCCHGLIGIRSCWKPKVQPSVAITKPSGSPATCIPATGTPTPMQKV